MNESMFNKEIDRQVLAQGMIPGADPDTIQVVNAIQSDGPNWYDANTKLVNEGLFAAYMIDKLSITKTRNNGFMAGDKRITEQEIKQRIFDEISAVVTYRTESMVQGLFNVIKRKLPEAPDEAAGSNGVLDYVRDLFASDIEAFTEGSNKKTGFNRFDNLTTGIYPGLYALGAISSLGKTTFVHQIADQMAAAGEHVIYFSLEQSRLDLVSKSISRLLAKQDIKNAITSLAVRKGMQAERVKAAALQYAECVGNRLQIIEGNFNCNVTFIEEFVADYIAREKACPVVIIDYLQILQPDAGKQRAQIRESIDLNVTELKRLSRAHNIPVIVISSFNRQNYLSPVDFESFKESGGIEYTADVVWGLQLACMNDDLFAQEKKQAEKRSKVKAAKAELPRKVDLVCLKTRYGNPDMIVHFDYNPRFDLFTETGAEGTDAETGFSVVNDLPDQLRLIDEYRNAPRRIR